MRLAFIALALAICAGTAARADNFETYCTVDGFVPAQRQTIVILDEHHVFPETDERDGRNGGWRRFIANLLLPSNAAALEQNFQPRERVTILLARKDGAGTRLIFSGCLPFFSAAERAGLKAKGGMGSWFSRFIGSDPVSAARQSMDIFRIQLGNAFRAALDPSALSRRPAADVSLGRSALVSSLKQGTIINFANGLPRIVLFSDLERFLGQVPQSTEAAREYGLKEAMEADLNLKGAELYVVGLSGGGPGRDALDMFLLASHAQLAGASSASALPAFLLPPKHISRYQGMIRYPEASYAIRVRLATDANGNAVNSWLSVQAESELFVPLQGVLTCADNGCVFSDQSFAQIWNTARIGGKQLKFSPDLPFGGARNLTLKIFGAKAYGSISDSNLAFQGLKNGKLEFSATLQPAALF